MTSKNLSTFLIVLLCVVCYYNSINCGFVFDDISAIKDNKDLKPSTPLKNILFNDFWGTPMKKEQSHKSYRPLCVLTFRWNFWVHGLEPSGYHLLNIILHIIVCFLFQRICGYFLPQSACSIAAFLFAVHPIHTEAVTGVVGRAEILSCLFFLSAFHFYVKGAKYERTDWIYLILMAISVAFAMLSKEQGITVTGICAVYEIFVTQKIRSSKIFKFLKLLFSTKQVNYSTLLSNKKILIRLTFLVSLTFSLLLGRMCMMGSQLPVFTRFDNPASVAATPWRQLTYNYLAALNVWLLLFPCDLCCDWTMGTVPLIESWFDARILTIIVTYSMVFSLMIVAHRTTKQHHSNIIIMGLTFMVLPFIPASNLFFPVGFVIAERILYMPSLGFCIIISYGHYLLSQIAYKKLITLSLILLIIFHSIKTHNRNWDWETEYSIFMAGLKVNQNNAKLFNNVGHVLEGENRFNEALSYFHKAVQVQNDDVGAYINVGRTYNHLNKFKEAEEAYLKAKSLLPKPKPGESYQARIAPNHLNVFINLANLISKNQTRLEEADLLYRQAISMRSDYIQAYINRGDILMRLNKTIEAQEVYERALLYDNENADIYYNLGVVFLEQKKSSQALAYLDKALELNPEHEQALLNSAILLQELGGVENSVVAKKRLFKLMEKDDKNERVHFNLGMLSMDEGNIVQAEHWFRRAIHLRQDFRSALFNLALLLADNNRPLEAVPFLNQLVRHHPNHIKGLILLGDIYINHIKDLDAAENCYREILRLEPTNIQGLHNLCVVFVERGKLAKAIACLEAANSLAISEDYISKHLEITKARFKKIIQSKGMIQEKQLVYSDYDPKEFLYLLPSKKMKMLKTDTRKRHKNEGRERS